VLQGLYPASYNVASFSYAVHSRAFAYHPSLLFILENPGFFVFCICICLCRWYCLLLSSNCRMYHVFNVLHFFFVHRLCLYKSLFYFFFFFFFPQKKNPTKKIVSHSPFLTKLYNYVVCFVDDDDDDD